MPFSFKLACQSRRACMPLYFSLTPLAWDCDCLRCAEAIGTAVCKSWQQLAPVQRLELATSQKKLLRAMSGWVQQEFFCWQILGLAMHYPVKLASEEGRLDEMLAMRSRSQKEIMGAKSKSLHAEVMLVARCAREGIATDGSWLYCLQAPCWNCVKALMMAGVTRIIFQEPDEHPSFQRQREVVQAAGAEWHCMVPSRKRLAHLKAFQDHWAKNHLPRLRAIKPEPALDDC
eukprot:s199_g18.t1